MEHFEYFFPKVDFAGKQKDVCWEWTAYKDPFGYGRFGSGQGKKVVLAHRYMWELVVGPIEHELDHLCRNPSCVRPSHLRDVPHQVNVAAGETGKWKRADHCKNGHPYNEENTYVYVDKDGSKHRHCRACGREAQRRYLAKK